MILSQGSSVGMEVPGADLSAIICIHLGHVYSFLLLQGIVFRREMKGVWKLDCCLGGYSHLTFAIGKLALQMFADQNPVELV